MVFKVVGLNEITKGVSAEKRRGPWTESWGTLILEVWRKWKNIMDVGEEWLVSCNFTLLFPAQTFMSPTHQILSSAPDWPQRGCAPHSYSGTQADRGFLTLHKWLPRSPWASAHSQMGKSRVKRSLLSNLGWRATLITSVCIPLQELVCAPAWIRKVPRWAAASRSSSEWKRKSRVWWTSILLCSGYHERQVKTAGQGDSDQLFEMLLTCR